MPFIKNIHPNILYQKIYYVLQGNKLFSGYLKSNPLFQFHNFNDFLSYLDELNLSHLVKGNDIYIDENGKNLSGGEKQRLLMALALYHDPEILLLDEPTSALDNENKKKVIMALLKHRKNKTTVIISHDKEFDFINNKVQL